jgi:tripartite-type tricarboxylate transporter receptor subunit TctC
MFGRKAATLGLGMLALNLQANVTNAESVESFYKGKQVRMIIGQAPGGGYDAYARLLASVMGKHIPGQPTIIPQNMEGASSLTAVNHLNNIAPKDGTVFGMGQRALLLLPMLDKDTARFEADKLTYIGSMDKDIGVCITWRGIGFDTLEDLKQKEIAMSTSGAGAELTTFYSVLPKVLGLKIKVISGYRGGASQELALERGEVQGRCGISYGSLVANRKEWIDNKKINILLQLGLAKNPDLPNVPLLMDYAKDPVDKKALQLMFTPLEMGRPFFAPPDIPADRADALRVAFERSMQDPELKEQAARRGLGLDWINGQTMQKMMAELYAMPPEVLERVKKLTTP